MRSDVVHDGADVVDTLLKRGGSGYSVRQALASLAEGHDAGNVARRRRRSVYPGNPRRRAASGTRGLRGARSAQARARRHDVLGPNTSSGRFPSKATWFGEPGSATSRRRPCRRRAIRPRSCKAGTWQCRQAKPTTTQSAPPGAPTGEPRYFSIPSIELGAKVLRNRALNC